MLTHYQQSKLSKAITACIPCLQHYHTEGNSGNPGDEAYDSKYREEEEDNSTRPVLSRQHVNGGRKTSDDVDDTSDPDELLGERAGQPDVGVTEDHGHGKAESE